MAKFSIFSIFQLKRLPKLNARSFIDPARLAAALTVVMNGLSIALLYLIYKDSHEASVYLISSTIISIGSLVAQSLSEQFIYYFHSIQNKSRAEACSFFSAYQLTTLFASFLLSRLLFSFSADASRIMAPYLDRGSQELLSSYIQISALCLFPVGNNILNQQFLIAINKIAASYLPSAMSLVGAIAFYIVSAVIAKLDLIYVLWASFYSSIAGLLLITFVIKTSLGRPTVGSFRKTAECIFVSIKIRTAHNMHNISLLTLTSTFASMLSPKLAAVYLYLKKIIDAATSILYGPFHRVIQSMVSVKSTGIKTGSFAPQFLGLCRKNSSNYLTSTLMIFPLVILFLASNGLESKSFMYMAFISALMLAQCYFVVSEVPFAVLAASVNSSKIFFATNSAYCIMIVFLFVGFGKVGLSSLSLPLAALGSQLINYFIIRNYAKRLLQSL